MSKKIYTPHLIGDAKATYLKAQKMVDGMDAIDRKYGNAAPPDCPLDMHLRTVIEALGAGLNNRDWDCVSQALVILQSAEVRARK